MKSSIFSVAWPAWTWALQGQGYLEGPKVQFLFASYAHTLSLRDSLKCRRVIESPWYQEHWGQRFEITGDQNTKVRFENNCAGYRLATSVGGALTGEGGAILGIDDAHNATEIESDVVRQSVINWWDTAMSTRLNSPSEGAKVLTMQRLHEDDLAGHVLGQGGWEHLILPARFEAERTKTTTIGNPDKRTVEGEPLWPEMYGDKELLELENVLGPWGSAGQLQQNPEPKGGGIIKRGWWKAWESEYRNMDFVLASLDTAYTEKQENDWSAIAIWGVNRDKNFMPRIVLMDAWQDRLELNDLVKKVGETCQLNNVDKLIIEDKASGHSVAQEIRRLLYSATWATQLVNPKGDKVARAYSVQHLFTQGVIHAPQKEKKWVSFADLLINQMAVFPHGKHDDLTDAGIQGLRWLRDSGWALRKEEQKIIVDRWMALPREDEPLYDV